ncbi:MAG TPA: LuxR family transcriptional regulator [Capillimicrobium sp.]|nr:LuxR family transcriptional regulator [Capillimicrobium sp.]
MIHGRARERARIASQVQAMRGGRSFALLVEGPAGIGKSTLLDDAVAQAGDVRVLRTRGFEGETDLPYAGLLELAGPILPLADALPEPRRLALHGALALADAPPGDRFAVPAALLALLGGAAEEGPVLVVADDVHWLDAATRDALLFAARRASWEGLGVLLAARDGDGEPIDAPELERLTLDPLDRDSAVALVRDAPDDPGPPLAPAAVEAVVDAGAGNPLALLELRRRLTPQQRAGAIDPAAPLRAGAELRDGFARRLDALPDPARRALCVVAAAGHASPDAIRAALAALDLPADALDAARDAGLLAGDAAAPALRHPLLAAAAYHDQPASARRAAHRALAGAVADPARRAWHLAHAATGPDAEAADALAAAARDARARGAHVEAARAGVRAAELTADPAARAGRELEAAVDATLGGQLALAGELADRAARHAPAPEAAATAELVRARVDMRTGDPLGGARRVEALAAQAAAAGQDAAAGLLLLEAAMAHMVGGDTAALLELAGRAREAAAAAGAAEVEMLAGLATGSTLVALGRRAEGEPLLDAAAPILEAADPLAQTAELVAMGATALAWMERFDDAERVCDRMVDAARRAGAPGRLIYPLDVRAQVRWRRGRWAAALADADEAVRLARETGQLPLLAVTLPTLARAEAGTGRLDAARDHGAEALALAETAGGAATAMQARAALGFAELTAGRADAALAWLDAAAETARAGGYGEPATTLMAGDHVEALLRAGRREDAERETAALAGAAARTGGAWAHAAAARCRAMLDDDAPPPALPAMPFEQARGDLVLGERLRRARRRAEARAPLEAALTAFERLGAEPWAARAAGELRATGGEHAAAAPSAPVAELTPHELQVALLVADGLTNREVAAALFLSPKTIEHHVGAIMRKLDLRSRTQLATLLGGEREPVGA